MRRRAGALLAALIIGTGLGALAGAGPAAAGGWAATVIDPLPGRIEAGQAYEVSFWVLQHGTHPYNWEQPASIGPVGLTLTDARGSMVSFPGRALPEPAHYATTVTVPRNGTWRVTGVQGIFESFHVGTLTVPGRLEALGVPAAPSSADLRKYWPGPVRPPVLRIDENRNPFEQQPSGVLDRSAAEAVAATPPDSADSAGAPATQWGARTTLLAAVIGGVVLLLGLGGGRRWWIRRGRSTLTSTSLRALPARWSRTSGSRQSATPGGR